MMTILDYVLDVFSNFSGGTYFTTREIIDLVIEKHNLNRTSLIPSDYCYNLTNKAKEENPTLKRFKLFLWLERGKYQYVGQNYQYSGKILRHPRRNERT